MNINPGDGDAASASIECGNGDLLEIAGRVTPDGVHIDQRGSRLTVTLHLYRRETTLTQTLAGARDDEDD